MQPVILKSSVKPLMFSAALHWSSGAKQVEVMICLSQSTSENKNKPIPGTNQPNFCFEFHKLFWDNKPGWTITDEWLYSPQNIFF